MAKSVQVVVRAGDSVEDLERKVRVASTLGTWQATLTQWKEGDAGLRAKWRENTVEERLLGVSLTGLPYPIVPELGRRRSRSRCMDAPCLGLIPPVYLRRLPKSLRNVRFLRHLYAVAHQ
jgi:hypothetical protein